MKNSVEVFESIFENSDILSNPFMDYTKAELEVGFELQQSMYMKAEVGSAPRRQAFTAIANVEIAFDAYAKGIKQFNIYVDDSTTLRDVLEDSYEVAHGEARTVEEMRHEAGLPSVVLVSSELLSTTIQKTKVISQKASNSLFDGIFHATHWLSNKTDPSKRK